METGAADRPLRRSILRGTLATIFANGWAMLLGLATLPLLLGGLGTKAFGTWVLLQTLSVTNGWLSLGDLGLGTSTVRHVAAEQAADRHDAASRVAGSALVGFTALGVVWTTLLAVAGPAVLPSLFGVDGDLAADLRLAVAWFSAQVLADFAVQGVLAVLEGAQLIDRSRGVEMLRRTLVTGGAAVAAAAGAGLVGVSIVGFVGTAASLVTAVVVLRRSPTAVVGRPAVADLRRLARYGSAVAVLRPLGVVHRTLDRFVVGIALGPAAVTLTEIATQLQNGTSAVLGASSYAVTPSAAWADGRGDRHRLRELVEVGTRYTLLATLPVAVLSAALAGPVIELWVGPDFGTAAPLVVLAVASLAVQAPLQVGSNLLVGIAEVRAVVRAAAAGLALNVPLSIALVGPMGVTGVFVATLVSGMVVMPLLGRAVLRAVDLPAGEFLRTAVLPPVQAALALAAAVAVPVALPLSPVVTLLTGGLGGLAAYAWAVMTMAMGRGELRSLLETLRRPAVA